MKRHISMLLPLAAAIASCGGRTAADTAANESRTPSLAEAYADCWYTGCSVNQWEVSADSAGRNDYDVTGMVSADQTANWDPIAATFNWVVAENCMKCEVIHPEEDRYDFSLADQFVDKARASGLKVLGHCLIWHSQCAGWFHVDNDGNLVDRETLKARIREHITRIMTHFKGRVDAWDVCNECFEDDGSLRRSLFYQIMGEDYIPWAFECARAADPDAELIYNDYSMNKPAKVEAVCRFFEPLIASGLKVSTIGMQGHIILADGAESIISQYDHSISCIGRLGVGAAFTELDLSVLPNPYGFSGANVSDRFAYRPEMDPYRDALPDSVQAAVDDFWLGFYRMLLAHRQVVNRVSFWCFNDANSWRNDFPIAGRRDYATLFDRQGRPKSTIGKLIDLRREAR